MVKSLQLLYETKPASKFVQILATKRVKTANKKNMLSRYELRVRDSGLQVTCLFPSAYDLIIVHHKKKTMIASFKSHGPWGAYNSYQL